MRFWRDVLRIVWHELTCPAARHGAAMVRHTEAGRVYDCGCGFGVMEAYDPGPVSRNN